MNRRLVETTDHASPAHLADAIEWYAANYMSCERPIVPALRRRFGISAPEACQVMRLALLRQDWQGGAHARTS